jgi:hypothetical protein
LKLHPRNARSLSGGANPMSDSDLDPGRAARDRDNGDLHIRYLDVLGVPFTPERLGENLAAFHDILREIEKLRQLDLTDVHPALIFEPTAPYRRDGGK